MSQTAFASENSLPASFSPFGGSCSLSADSKRPTSRSDSSAAPSPAGLRVDAHAKRYAPRRAEQVTKHRERMRLLVLKQQSRAAGSQNAVATVRGSASGSIRR